MSVLRTSDPIALRLLFSDELYLVDEPLAHIASNEGMLETAEVAQVQVAKPTEPAKVPEAAHFTAPPAFDYLGENNKYFLLLVNQPGNTILNAKDLESLTSILNAKKLEIRDVAILNLNKYQGVSFNMLKSFFVNTRLVLFGIDPRDLQLPQMAANKITSHEGVKILPTFSFGEMNADASLKRVFWNEMKVL